MTTHEVLVAARNLIDREGWCQHAAYDGPRCTLGALGAAAIEADVYMGPIWVDASHALEAVTGLSWSEIPGWNDAPGRTKQEVLAAFDKAIAETAPPPADPFPVERCETTKAVVV